MKKNLPLLFLPSLLSDDRIFAPQLAFLKKEFPKMPCAVADLTRQESIPEMAESAFEFAASRGWGDFLVCGISLGGVVAMEMMGWPEVVGAILISCHYLPDSPERRAAREELIRKTHQGWFREILKEMREQAEKKPFHLDLYQPQGERLWKTYKEMALAQGEQVFVRQHRALLDRGNYEAVLENFGGPSLIIGGEEDPLVPPQRLRTMVDHLLDVEITTIPEAGHLPTLEKPVEVSQRMGQWLREH